MDPAFRLMRFPLDDELNFNLKMILFIKIMTWSRYLFLFYFQRVNKIRKKNPKCDSWFWKRWSTKNQIGLGSQVTYREGTVKIIAPLQVPKAGSLLIKWSWHDTWWVNQWICEWSSTHKNRDMHRQRLEGKMGTYLGNEPPCAISREG